MNASLTSLVVALPAAGLTLAAIAGLSSIVAFSFESTIGFFAIGMIGLILVSDYSRRRRISARGANRQRTSSAPSRETHRLAA